MMISSTIPTVHLRRGEVGKPAEDDELVATELSSACTIF